MREQNQERWPKLVKRLNLCPVNWGELGGTCTYSLRRGWISGLDVSQQVVTNIELHITCLSWTLFLFFFFFSFLLLQLFFVISILILFYFIHFSPVLLPSPLCGGECFSNCMLLSCWLGLNYNSMILCMFVKYNPEEKKKSYSSSCLQCSALYFTVFRICVWGTTVFWQQILFTLSLLWVLLSLF